MLYYDSALILKLYTNEANAGRLIDYVTSQNQPVHIHALHRAELTSATRLKVFRKEITQAVGTRILGNIEDDIRTGVLNLLDIDWSYAWRRCRILADTQAAASGCRTLDTLHVACAQSLGIRQIVTNDIRQSGLARAIGMGVVNPLG